VLVMLLGYAVSPACLWWLGFLEGFAGQRWLAGCFALLSKFAWFAMLGMRGWLAILVMLAEYSGYAIYSGSAVYAGWRY